MWRGECCATGIGTEELSLRTYCWGDSAFRPLARLVSSLPRFFGQDLPALVERRRPGPEEAKAVVRLAGATVSMRLGFGKLPSLML